MFYSWLLSGGNRSESIPGGINRLDWAPQNKPPFTDEKGADALTWADHVRTLYASSGWAVMELALLLRLTPNRVRVRFVWFLWLVIRYIHTYHAYRAIPYNKDPLRYTSADKNAGNLPEFSQDPPRTHPGRPRPEIRSRDTPTWCLTQFTQVPNSGPFFWSSGIK